MSWLEDLEAPFGEDGSYDEPDSENDVCQVCGGCTLGEDCDCFMPPCCCQGDSENVLPKEY